MRNAQIVFRNRQVQYASIQLKHVDITYLNFNGEEKQEKGHVRFHYEIKSNYDTNIKIQIVIRATGLNTKHCTHTHKRNK